MVDQFFTPQKIAVDFIKQFESKNTNVVADFAVGSGSLLNAINFKVKTVIGLDIDDKIIKQLQRTNPKWQLQTGDFINPDETTKNWLNNWKQNIDLIILNPPFSCKGNKRIIVNIEDTNFKCRTSLAFILKATQFLRPSGVLIAILPLSCIKSEADTEVLNFLKNRWSLKFGNRLGSRTFAGCSSNSIILTLEKGKAKKILSHEKLDNNYENFSVEIIRGSIPMYKTNLVGKYKVIHTSHLQKQGFNKKNFKFYDSDTKKVRGVFLCIPRVCQPSKEKIAIIKAKNYHLLSDCVIALQSDKHSNIFLLQKLILKHWDEFIALYESTCAPYLTLNQLCNFLRNKQVGFKVVQKFSNVKDNFNLLIYVKRVRA